MKKKTLVGISNQSEKAMTSGCPRKIIEPIKESQEKKKCEVTGAYKNSNDWLRGRIEHTVDQNTHQCCGKSRLFLR